MGGRYCFGELEEWRGQSYSASTGGNLVGAGKTPVSDLEARVRSLVGPLRGDVKLVQRVTAKMLIDYNWNQTTLSASG